METVEEKDHRSQQEDKKVEKDTKDLIEQQYLTHSTHRATPPLGLKLRSGLPPDTLGEGMTLKVFMIRSGYSSRILLISRVPMPEPVPPPRE